MRYGSEAVEQTQLFLWASWQSGKYPELELMYHIPNGGSRNAIEAANLKKQGVKSGVPDICLPVARMGFHGLFIEMKVGKNKPSDNQKRWISDLNEQGYRAEVCYGWEEASKVISEYLGIGKSI